MRRSIIFAIAAVAALSALPVRAGVNTTTALQQTFYVSGGVYTVNGFTAAGLNLRNEVGASSVGAVVTPGARFEADAYTQSCTVTWVCTYTSFATQTISPTAFSMDPAGNSGTFRACLLPTSGPCKAFDVTMTRPGYVAAVCGTACVSPNAWYDPTTGTVGGNAFALAGVTRQGYVVGGVFAGGPPLVLTSAMTTYTFDLVNTDTAS